MAKKNISLQSIFKKNTTGLKKDLINKLTSLF